MAVSDVSAYKAGTAKTKLSRDLIWNYASLGILAVSGILINALIAGAYGAARLGVFNQIYAIYIMASQFAAAGVHFSVLKHIAEFAEDRRKHDQIISSAVGLSLSLGLIVAAMVFLLRGLFGIMLASPAVSDGLRLAAPALVFFSLNKVLFAALNGLRRMRAFAFSQALRYILMLGFITSASVLGWAGHVLAAVFIFSEGLLFLALLILVRPHASFAFWKYGTDWVKIHAAFGAKGFISGVLLEINTRIDVLMLGFFLSDKVVGIYSFAAMLAEGLYQFLVVIRNNFNPMLVQLIAERKFEELRRLMQKTRRILYPVTAAAALLLIGLFPLGISWLHAKTEFMQSWPVLAILVLGISACSGFTPFDGIMIQAGFPGYRTVFNMMSVGSNIILNSIMIPVWGANGAAIATGCSYVLAIVYLNTIVKSKLNFSLW